MGLDMYLTAKLITYKTIYTNEMSKKHERVRKEVKKNLPEIFSSGNLETMEISFEAGYWRKANQIHNWFVENVQNGDDDCWPHGVSREALKELRELCKNALKIAIMDPNDKVLREILPTREGFFFGNAEYGEDYIEDIKRTIKIINKCLKLPDDWSFEYQSSW